MRVMNPGPARDEIVAQMLEILRRDAVWLSGWHSLDYYLNNPWIYNTKRHGISKTAFKYLGTRYRNAKNENSWSGINLWYGPSGVLGVLSDPCWHFLGPGLSPQTEYDSLTETPNQKDKKKGLYCLFILFEG